MKELKSQKAVDSFLKKNGRGQVWFRNSGKYNREFRNRVTGEVRSVGTLKFFDEEKANKLLDELLLVPGQLVDERNCLRGELDSVKAKLVEKLDADDFSRDFEGDDFSELASRAQVLAVRLKALESL